MTGKKSSKDARTERLEAALKANLKRRKAQSRARKAEETIGDHPEKTSSVPVSSLNITDKFSN